MDPVVFTAENKNDEIDKSFNRIYETFKEPKPMTFDENAKKLHESQTKCYACGSSFDDKEIEFRKVRDHCHFTGKCRGALHSKCNLRLKRTFNIPVFFHNLSGYDSHLFVKRLADSEGDVNCIPRNEEKYIIFNKKGLVDKKNGKDEIFVNFRFTDSFNFMQTLLEKLVDNMERENFKHASKYF